MSPEEDALYKEAECLSFTRNKSAASIRSATALQGLLLLGEENLWRASTQILYHR